MTIVNSKALDPDLFKGTMPIIIYQIKAGLDLDVDEFYKLTWEGDDRDIQKIAKVIAKRPKRATGLK